MSRILFVADDPLAESFGHGQRLLALERGLRWCGDVTTALINRSEVLDAGRGYDHVFPDARANGPTLLAAMARHRLPSDAISRSTPGLQEWMRGIADSDFDLIWFNRLKTYAAVRPVLPGLAIIDYDDLNDRFISAATQDPDYPRTRRSRLARHVDRHLWAQLQRRAAADADAIVVCSDVDAAHLGVPNAHVIPNGYAEDARLAAQDRRGCPILVFVGPMHYGPNISAARLLAREVLPLVRRAHPATELWLVGRNETFVSDLATVPGVRTLGWVDDLDEVFDQAWIAMTPLRSGAGTRIKVLEAMGRGVPQVSTSFGPAGIDVRHGEHLLIGDSAEDLARHTCRLIDEPVYARQLRDNARSWFESHGTWSRSSERVAALASDVLGSRMPATGMG